MTVSRPKFDQTKDPVLISIKTLNTNQTYLSGLTFPTGAVVTNYETIHDNFVERYIFAKVGKFEVLIGEMFYPEELDSVLTPYTYDFLQRMIKRLDIISKPKNHFFTQEELELFRNYDYYESAFD